MSGDNLKMTYEAYEHVPEATQHYTKQAFTPGNGDGNGDDENYSASDVVGAFQWTGTSLMKQAEWTYVFEEGGTGYYVEIPDVSEETRDQEYPFEWQYMGGGIIQLSIPASTIYIRFKSKNTITEYYDNNTEYETSTIYT